MFSTLRLTPGDGMRYLHADQHVSTLLSTFIRKITEIDPYMHGLYCPDSIPVSGTRHQFPEVHTVQAMPNKARLVRALLFL